MKFNTSKELFDFIRTTDTSDFPSLKKILEKYDSPRVTVNDILSELKDKNEKVLLVDARSEKEFDESSLPCSVNFPVLNNEERHNTRSCL
ncbi:MAG: hypothetical protein R2942_04710 [Ignavibacteria bacterium]